MTAGTARAGCCSPSPSSSSGPHPRPALGIGVGSFEIPEGFVVKESHAHQVSTADVTRDLDGDGIDDFILRISRNGNMTKN
jgi:hypothetical protein